MQTEDAILRPLHEQNIKQLYSETHGKLLHALAKYKQVYVQMPHLVKGHQVYSVLYITGLGEPEDTGRAGLKTSYIREVLTVNFVSTP